MKKHTFFYIFILIFAFQTTASAQDYSLFGLKGKVRTATITDEDDETLMEIEFDENGSLTSYSGYLINVSSDSWTRSGNTITDKGNFEGGYTYNPSCMDKDIDFARVDIKTTLEFKNGKLYSESIYLDGQSSGLALSAWYHVSETYTFEYEGNYVKKGFFLSKYEDSNNSLNKSDNQKKSSDTYNYIYTEFDKYGNWTKRKDQNGNIEKQNIIYDEEWMGEHYQDNILQVGTTEEVYKLAIDRNNPDSIRQVAAERWGELRLDELTASKDIKGLENYIMNSLPSTEQKVKAKALWNETKMEQYQNTEDLYVLENLHNNPLTSDANKKSIRTRWNNLSWQEAAKKKSAEFYAYISTSPMAYEEVAKNGWSQMCEMKYRELIDAQTDFTKVDKYRKLAYDVKSRNFNYSGTGKAVFDDAFQKRISEKKETLRQNKINELLKESMQAIDEQKYLKGLNHAKAVLEIDKGNKTAQNLCCKADHGILSNKIRANNATPKDCNDFLQGYPNCEYSYDVTAVLNEMVEEKMKDYKNLSTEELKSYTEMPLNTKLWKEVKKKYEKVAEKREKEYEKMVKKSQKR